MKFEFVDCHAHTNFAAFDGDRDAVIRRALNAGVAVVNVGTQRDTSAKAVELAERYDSHVYAIVGLHPIHTDKSHHDEKELGSGNRVFASRGEIFDSEFYRKLAVRRKVVAVGECGLDYYCISRESERKQRAAFSAQIALANEIEKPIMLHVRCGPGGARSAYRDALSILRLEARVTGNFHFYAGTTEELEAILDAGFYVSFTGVITFARDYEVLVRYAPLERILSETDCPYVAPLPFRGERNEPLRVREVAKAIARIRNADEDKIREQLCANAELFFGISLRGAA